MKINWNKKFFFKEYQQLDCPMHVRKKTKGIFFFSKGMMEGGGRINAAFDDTMQGKLMHMMLQ
jgi:hypothetical protein